MQIDEGDFSDVFNYEILVCRDVFDKENDGAFRAEITCGTGTTAMRYTVWHETRALKLTGDLTDIGRSVWSGLDDPLIAKISAIAKAARIAGGGSAVPC